MSSYSSMTLTRHSLIELWRQTLLETWNLSPTSATKHRTAVSLSIKYRTLTILTEFALKLVRCDLLVVVVKYGVGVVVLTTSREVVLDSVVDSVVLESTVKDLYSILLIITSCARTGPLLVRSQLCHQPKRKTCPHRENCCKIPMVQYCKGATFDPQLRNA